MAVELSGDVSLEGASFSECTARYVCLPRPHTLASPVHARSHAIAAARIGRRRQRDNGVAGPAFAMQRAALGLPALSRSLTPSLLNACPHPTRAERRRYVRVQQRQHRAGGRQLQQVHGSQCASPTPAHARLPRAHTLARPIAAPEASEEGRGTMGWQDPLSPQRAALGLPALLSLSDALAFAPQLGVSMHLRLSLPSQREEV